MISEIVSHIDWIIQIWGRFTLIEVLFSILLFLIIFPLSRIVKKRSPYWHFGLWLFIYLRLILPQGFSMNTSIWQVLDQLSNKLPVMDNIHATEWFLASEIHVQINEKDVSMTNNKNLSSFLKWIPRILFPTWLIVVLLQMRIYLIRKKYFYRIIKNARKVSLQSTTEQVNFWRTQFKIKRGVLIFSSDGFLTPFTMGIMRPKIFLPSPIIENSNHSIQNAAIAHEMAHIKRLDALWMIFQNMINIVFFFVPIIWFASREVNRSREQICDQMVLMFDQFKPTVYASAIIDTLRSNLTGYTTINFVPAFINNHKQIIQQRITSIMENKKMNKNEWIVIIISVFTLAISVLPMSNILNASEPIKPLNSVFEKTVVTDKPFQTPIKEGVISSKFGMRMHPVLKEQRMHNGIDIAAPKGTEVYAIQSGKIIFADMDGAWGNKIVVTHDGIYSSIYGQLSEILAKAGEVVQPGQLIGKVGSSGISTAPHLHFEIRENNQPIDPQEMLDFSGLKKANK